LSEQDLKTPEGVTLYEWHEFLEWIRDGIDSDKFPRTIPPAIARHVYLSLVGSETKEGAARERIDRQNSLINAHKGTSVGSGDFAVPERPARVCHACWLSRIGALQRAASDASNDCERIMAARILEALKALDAEADKDKPEPETSPPVDLIDLADLAQRAEEWGEVELAADLYGAISGVADRRAIEIADPRKGDPA